MEQLINDLEGVEKMATKYQWDTTTEVLAIYRRLVLVFCQDLQEPNPRNGGNRGGRSGTAGEETRGGSKDSREGEGEQARDKTPEDSKKDKRMVRRTPVEKTMKATW